MNILFLHGWRSVLCGVKPMYLAQHGHEGINPKLPGDDLAEKTSESEAEQAH